MPVEVNGIRIGEQEIEGMVGSIRQHYAQAPEQPSDDAAREMAIDRLVDHALVREAADKGSAEIAIDDVHAFYLDNKSQDLLKQPLDVAKREVESRIRIGKTVDEVTGNVAAVTAEEAKTFYDGNPKSFERPARVHAAHIVKQVKDGDEASARTAIDAVKAKLDEGAVFEELAKEESDCQENGFDLGGFPRGQMVDEFESVVFEMEEGAISDPFLSPFGFHIAKLYKKMDADTVVFDEVSERLQSDLTNRRKHAAMQGFLGTLRKEATIVMTEPEEVAETAAE